MHVHTYHYNSIANNKNTWRLITPAHLLFLPLSPSRCLSVSLSLSLSLCISLSLSLPLYLSPYFLPPTYLPFSWKSLSDHHWSTSRQLVGD